MALPFLVPAHGYLHLERFDDQSVFARASLEKCLHIMQMHLFVFCRAGFQPAMHLFVAQGARARRETGVPDACLSSASTRAAKKLHALGWWKRTHLKEGAGPGAFRFMLVLRAIAPLITVGESVASCGIIARLERGLSRPNQKRRCHHEVAAAPGSPTCAGFAQVGVVATEGSAF